MTNRIERNSGVVSVNFELLNSGTIFTYETNCSDQNVYLKVDQNSCGNAVMLKSGITHCIKYAARVIPFKPGESVTIIQG